jgi:hypothetical protein
MVEGPKQGVKISDIFRYTVVWRKLSLFLAPGFAYCVISGEATDLCQTVGIPEAVACTVLAAHGVPRDRRELVKQHKHLDLASNNRLQKNYDQ